MADPSLARLIDHGLFGEALRHIAKISRERSLTPSEQVEKLELLSLTSAKDSCVNPAIQLAKSTQISDEHRVRCHLIAGTGLLKEGSDNSGRTHLRKAAALAVTLNTAIHCGAKLQELEALVAWSGPEAAVSEISETRRLVEAVASPTYSARLHLTLAELAGRQGLLHRAERHLNVASELLSTLGNKYLDCELMIRKGAVSLFSSDLDSAISSSEEALRLALVSGAPTLEVVARSNLGHALLAHGKLTAAEAHLIKALSLCRAGGTAELGIRDNLLQLAMAAWDHDIATARAEETYSRLEATEGGDTYPGLWHVLTRVKWLFRRGDPSAGFKLATDALHRIERIADRILLERMQLLAAEGLGRLGRTAEGAALLATAVKANLDPPLELMAEASRVAGRLTAVDDPDAARSHFQRAARIFASVGNVTARGEVERDAAETLGTAAVPMLSTADAAPLTLREDGHPRRPPAAALTERIAALVELGAHAPLLAAEACSLLADTGAAVDATVVATRSSGQGELVAPAAASTTTTASDDHAGAIRIDAGSHRDRLYSVVAVPHGTASARATLLAVERLVHIAVSLARARQNEREQAALWPDHTPEQELGLLCVSERMLELINMIRRVASAPYAVLITGETGVGKELFARALHLASPRRERVFMPFNCTAASRDMMDSQLFGHRRGAFTGATEDGTGVIRAAAGGTLFLDEIGEMSPDVQPKLLRFLESGEILPLGETRPQTVDVRIVAATNANLDQLVADGRFREDLYFRLNVIPIPIPPLRERREEIPALVGHFLERFGKEMQKPGLRVADETLEYLLLHRWPGNVRQLANELRRIVALAEPGATIMPAHLGPDIIASRRTVPVEPTEIVMRLDQALADATEQIERAVIERALAACGGRNDEAAKRLGLSRKGLYLKKQRLGIKD